MLSLFLCFIANSETWNDLHESIFDICDDDKHSRNCLTFNADTLCTHYHSDHNYYALCRNLLSQYADEPEAGRMDGLLHDMPVKAKVGFLELSTCLFSSAETYLQHYVKIYKSIFQRHDGRRTSESRNTEQMSCNMTKPTK